MKDSINFDMDAALTALRERADLGGKDGILTPLIKQLTKATMQAELDNYLQSESGQNRKNGISSKTIKTAHSSFELEALAIVLEALSHNLLKSTKRI